MNSILDKALLSEKDNKLHLNLQKLLNQVYTITIIKEKFFYQSAIDEYQRIEGSKTSMMMEGEEFSTSQENLINKQSIEQMEKIHKEFIKNFIDFKNNLNLSVSVI